MKDQWCKFCKKLYKIDSAHWGLKKNYGKRKDTVLYCSKKLKEQKHKANMSRTPYSIETYRKYIIKGRYNITIQQYQEMLLIQDGKCKICDTVMTKPHIDHDHASGRIRGLLCRGCNWGLGHFKDDTKYLQSAIKYLTVKHPPGQD